MRQEKRGERNEGEEMQKCFIRGEVGSADKTCVGFGFGTGDGQSEEMFEWEVRALLMKTCWVDDMYFMSYLSLCYIMPDQ